MKDEMIVNVTASLFEENDRQAAKNRRAFQEMGTVVLNLISSPGSGKTSLLERTIARLKDQVGIGVIEGDPETARDAERIRRQGVPVIQLTTGGGCHLDAPMVDKGLQALTRVAAGKKLDLLFIENVGNLVCPASFDLGETKRVVLLSVPEGSDKPVKYPATFRSADLVLITKTDLVPYFDFKVEEAKEFVRILKPDMPVLSLAAEKDEGMDAWIAYLQALLRN